MTTDELLAEIRLAIDAIETWKPHQDPDLKARGACAWEGDSPDGWRILVAAWPAETDTTRWGFDGTAVRAPLVVRLTPELAERAARRATRERRSARFAERWPILDNGAHEREYGAARRAKGKP